MRSEKFRGTPKPDWMVDRQTDLLLKAAFALIYIAFICFLVGYSMVMDAIDASAEALTLEPQTTKSAGLYAGALNTFTEAEKTPVVTTEIIDKEVAKAAPEPEESQSKWTADDYERLAHLIYAEAGAQGETCMIYVGSVVLNRVSSDRYPNTIKAVINQKGQYTVKGWYMSREPSETAYHIANYLLEEGSQLPEWVLYQHGNNRAVAGTKVYKRVNGEVFSYEERDRK